MELNRKKNNVFLQLLDLVHTNVPVIFTTVTGTIGSAPQKPGSSAIWGTKGLISGTVGGGSVENAVAQLIPDTFKSQVSGFKNFSLNHNIDDQYGSICGGSMRILIDASPQISKNIFVQLGNSIKNREAGILVSSISPEGTTRIDRIWISESNLSESYSSLHPAVAVAVEEMLHKREAKECQEISVSSVQGDKEILFFLERIRPLPRLLIAGAGHVGKALSHLGKLLDFEVFVWDDRLEYANTSNLPDADQILSGSSDVAFNNFHPDEDTYIVIVTRGHKQDAEVLKEFIGGNARYLGMMGSKRKILQIREKFLTARWASENQWNTIFTPVGLDIGSVTVNEIAVSIAAQLIKIRNNANG